MDKKDLKIGDKLVYIGTGEKCEVISVSDKFFATKKANGKCNTLEFELLDLFKLDVEEELKENINKSLDDAFKTDEYGFTDPLENELVAYSAYKKLELENEKLHKAFDKLFDAFMKLNASNDKLIDKLLN